MRVVACLLALASSALAYSVTVPNAVQGWTNQGGQPLAWSRVSTDALNFTAVLVNQQTFGFTPQVLAALVDGTTGKTTLNPPSGGWPTGKGFQVNLVLNDTELNTIFAQSGTFNITESTASVSSTRTGSTTSTTGANTGTGGAITPTSSAGDSSNTDPIVLPTGNAAISATSLNGGLLGLFAFMGFVLA